MDILFGSIGSFLLGIVTAPLLVKTYQVYAERKILQAYEAAYQRAEMDHAKHMESLKQEWNEEAELFNRRLAAMKQRLARRSLFLEIDEAGKQIVVKRIPITEGPTNKTQSSGITGRRDADEADTET